MRFHTRKELIWAHAHRAGYYPPPVEGGMYGHIATHTSIARINTTREEKPIPIRFPSHLGTEGRG